MVQAIAIPKPPQSQPELESEYLVNRRQRFKTLINRLSGGEMRRLLGAHPEAEALAFPLTYVYALHWLQEQVHPRYRPAVLVKFRSPARAFLMDLLEGSAGGAALVRGYIAYWQEAPIGNLLQQRQLQSLLASRGGDAERLAADLLAVWDGLGLFRRTEKQAYKDLGQEERERYAGMLGAEDLERLALVDALPEPSAAAPHFAKLGIIPAMGCPQTCRHCMFIWRPPMRNTPDPERVLRLVDACTDSVLFTGGDLTRHLEHFYRAIREMRRVRTFAILLIGEFAEDMAVTDATLKAMADAVRSRPADWPSARVLLQISFDEFHQEILTDREGRLRERIPVAKTANILECGVRYPEIQVALLHKQNGLNFSMELFQRGVFARLAKELGRRGHQVQVLSAAPSRRAKRNPLKPEQSGAVVKDASFVLARFPDRPILFTSSTIDAYGRATLLEAGEAVDERDLVEQLLRTGSAPEADAFDTDLMFWFNGWATLFSAVHICLGDLYQDGADKIFARQRKDPLTRALGRLDRRLLDFYAELHGDLEQLLARATSPHQLFHAITEDPLARLHMTRRLLEIQTTISGTED